MLNNHSADIAWRPTPEYIERSRLAAFMHKHDLGSVEELLRRSTADMEWFWPAVMDDLGLEWFRPYTKVLDLSGGVEWPRWFVDGRYNYVHDALDKQALRLRPDAEAVRWEGENGEVITFTFAQLYGEVCKAANALKEMGVGRGDRVGVFMPMLPETAVVTLAISKVGAVYIPIFSGFGGGAVASRLNDGEAKVLVTADGFYRGGKVVPLKEAADEAARLCPSLKHMLVVRRTSREVPWTQERDLWWDDVVERQPPECATEETGAEDPYIIIYTSGTTGKPKGVVHVHAGFPLKAAQELAHCFDLHAGERLFWISDIGWMMGPWAIAGALMLGATCVLYEGAIGHPGPDRIWSLVEQHRVTHLGISPTAVRALMGHGEEPVKSHDVSSLVVLSGAGEPWNREAWLWLHEVVGEGKRPLINYSGGTEVAGGILSSTTLLPIKPCAFSCPVPGMAADVVDAEGRSLRGAVGELAIRGPWPGITRGFWGDPERYVDTYWSRVPGVWMHGDWAKVDEDGFWHILGRSDDTIKVAGKRIGPAEVEQAAIAHPSVLEAAAIGVPDALKGEALVVFAVLRPGQVGDEELRTRIETEITRQLGKSLKPQAVLFVKDLPRTRNGKILRRLARQQYLGEPLGDVSALESAEALRAISEAS